MFPVSLFLLVRQRFRGFSAPHPVQSFFPLNEAEIRLMQPAISTESTDRKPASRL